MANALSLDLRCRVVALSRLLCLVRPAVKQPPGLALVLHQRSVGLPRSVRLAMWHRSLEADPAAGAASNPMAI